MARSLYSDDLENHTDNLSQNLVEDLEILRSYLNKRKLKVLKWDDDNIAIPFSVNIILPPRGNYNGIDIRKTEDVLFVFNKKLYPAAAPKVYSDRKSFPKDGISHLYVSRKDAPAPFCLIRGDYNEWFANKRVTDLVIRVRSWLKDAANGSLVEDGGQFDPMRLEGYQGNIVYKYQQLVDVFEDKKQFEKKLNFTLLLIKEKEKPRTEGDKIKYPGYEVVRVLTNIEELKETYKPIIEKLAQNEAGLGSQRLLIGAVIRSENDNINDQFPNQLPKDLDTLLKFAIWADIDLSKLLAIIPIVRTPGIKEFPVLLSVKRPKPLIGYNGDIEFFNFYLTIEDDAIVEGVISKNLPVGFQKHNEPLSIKKAQEVSGSKSIIGSSVVFGCGAVGSKVMMHLIREGYAGTSTVLFDHDKIEPHNMVRYGLLTDSIGVNKAVAIQKTAEELYEADNDNLQILGIPHRGNVLFELDRLKKCLKGVDWIMDFTASVSFENYFIKQELEARNRVVRGSLTDEGRIGMLLIEGNDRNPRIDDLKVLSQAEYLTNVYINAWLKREFFRSKKESALINVGVGCNSETTIVPDDTISIHSSIFVKAIKAESKVDSQDHGVIYQTYLDDSNNFTVRSERRIIPPLRVYQSISGWEIRMKAGLDEMLMSEMGKAMPNETGGVLIGLVNNKTKCLHITDIILAPPDSEANSGCFIRGVEGLKDQVDMHKNESGQTFGYIGEWHSHPFGPYGPSDKDIRTMREFKKDYEEEGVTIPVFVMIATPAGLIPCIY